MRFDVVSIFPDFVRSVVRFGVAEKAATRGLVELVTWNPRDFTSDRHRSVDDRPYGGGPGMVMKFTPLRDALRAARASRGDGAPVVYLSPQGAPLTQRRAEEMSRSPGVILLCGRYEGVDERLIEAEVDEELSLGDYVLSGGELGAMVVIDAVSRLLPGVLGHEDSAVQDSFTEGLLDCPHYTRPEDIDGRGVPAVLLGGDHGAVERWRRKQALGRTWLRRPELLRQRSLDAEAVALLREFIEEYRGEPGR
jgi:tRNA (guanine37-N1)-methyltransferase